ncbi:RsfA family transcriptional regulator [Bacillus sp. FJAT-45350]|uniref:RsfA family transcriptional regulator n=1 Tax=Bacillus sp. FJAT-45350 TaxID=2011014 RepID=UPI000BB7DEB1|nr:RsfA family transcriptional regulator [Bacillus sp. FJAT-45350]
MSVIRQDAWSSDEDLILAEVVLRHIREGSTQLAAFEEVGERLSRTSAACGFRWNSAIRKKYDAAIALAKKQRKKGKSNQPEEQEQVYHVTEVEFAEEQYVQGEEKLVIPANEKAVAELTDEVTEEEQSTLSISDVIAFLKQHESSLSNRSKVERENESLKKENKELQKRVDVLKKDVEKLRKDKEIVNEDYRALIGIMERARKMSILVDEPKERTNAESR